MSPIPKFCPKCGERVPDEALFCPECGTRITAPARAPPPERPIVKEEKRGARIAGGVLTIIASCFCLITGIGGLSFSYTPAILTLGIAGFIAFAFGLTAGVLTLTKKVFALAIVGEIFVLVAGVLACIPIKFDWGYIYAWPVGILIFILVLLGLIFTSVAKQDFR